MDDCVPFHPTENQLSIDSTLEMVQRLDALRSLVCDLLTSNQELRHALVEARASKQNHQRPQRKHADSEAAMEG